MRKCNEHGGKSERKTWCGGWKRKWRLIDHVAFARIEHLRTGPALGDDPLEERPDEALVAVGELRVQLEDGFARALDQALRFAMRDREIAADEVLRKLDDHPNSSEPAALEKG